MPLDPELEVALRAVQERMPSEVLTLETIPERRRLLADLIRAPSNAELALDGAFQVEERRVPGPPGAPDVKLLICRPTGAPAGTAAIYHIHAGGLISLDNRAGLAELLGIARDLKAAVVSVEYRLAPETRHPGPVEDCYAGLVWLAAHAAELGIDPARIVVYGASAGGGLAAALGLLTRDRGGPAPAAQMLLAPMLDDRNNTPSAIQMTGEGMWDRGENQVGWIALLGDETGGPDVSPYAAAARATDLSGLPPTFVDVGAAETFRDEAISYASRIWSSGGQAELHVWPGAFHGHTGLAPHARVSRETVGARRAWLHRLLAA